MACIVGQELCKHETDHVIVFADNQHLTFRGNSLATKAMEAHMKLVGRLVCTVNSHNNDARYYDKFVIPPPTLDIRTFMKK